jgi:hypothetical protein
MTKLVNLKSDQLGGVVRRVRRAETTNALDSGSVDNGRTTFRGPLSLVVSGSALVSGLLTVSGSSVVSGLLNVVGQLIVSGTQTLTGIFNANGPWNLAGTGGITGDVSSTGVWTQTGTYKVSPGGKIILEGASPVTLGTTSDGRPGLEFAGGRLSSASDRIALTSGNATIGAAPAFAAVAFDTKSVVVRADGVYLDNLPTTTQSPNLYADSSGKLFRSTAGTPAGA